MKTYKPNEIKNIALVGSAGSGKTTLAEAMMYEGGVIPRRGSISAKNTSSDYRPENRNTDHQYSRLYYTQNGRSTSSISLTRREQTIS